MEPSRSFFQKIHKDPSQKSSWNKHNMFFIQKPFSGFNQSENCARQTGFIFPKQLGWKCQKSLSCHQPINQIMTTPQKNPG